MNDDDNLYIRKRKRKDLEDDGIFIDPNEKVPGELSDDDAYVI
jgi:hypothetical protein